MNEKKLASKAGVFCYGLGEFGSNFVWTFIGSYLSIYYTDIVGITPIAVSIIMIIARVWDAVNDPMMGFIAENSKSRWGRFRPYIAIGAPLMAISMIFVFTNPFAGSASSAKVIFAAIIYIISGMLYTLVSIPYGALLGVMTEDNTQRNAMNVSRNIGMNAGMIILNIIAPTLLLRFSGKGAEVANGHGYTMTAILFACIAIPCYLLVVFTSKEIVRSKNKTERYGIKDTLMNLVKNRYLLVITLVMVTMMFGYMGRISVVTYYAIYCMGSFQMITWVMTLPSIGSIIGCLAMPFLAKRFGRRNVFMTANIVMAVCLFIIYITPYTNVMVILIFSAIYGLASLGYPICLGMVADSVDYMEWKTGKRTDGTTYATYTLAVKLGNALGGSVFLIIMAAFGYVANQQQTAEAMHGINITVNLIPAIFLIISAVCLLLWNKKDSDFDKIREELRVRREQ